ncbi:MAG: permease [Variovorax sp.]|nr:permease [Variovorax sp.]
MTETIQPAPARVQPETAAPAAPTAVSKPAKAESPPPASTLADLVAPRPRRDPLLLHMPVDVRSVSLALIATLAVLFTLRWAAAVFIPLMVSLLLTYALTPLVDGLVRCRVPRWIGAAVVLLGLSGAVGGAVYSFGDNAVSLANSLPLAAQKFQRSIKRPAAGPTTIESVQNAAAQLEKAAETAPRPANRPGVTRVLIERPPFNVRDYLWSGTIGLLSAAGQLTVVLFLTFFALGSGDTFRRKMVKITGPSLSKKKITVQVLDEVTNQIQRYLLVQLVTSVVVGILTGLALWALGLDNAVVWGIAAGVLNMVPYLGSIVVMATSALVAFLQFGEIDKALLVGGASLLIHALVGNLLTPWLTSRASRMSPLVVFIGVLAWGWLWGVWGLLLGIPIMMVVKAICDRVEDLQPIGELLGD